MTQEEKDLLLQDLSARLPYGVKVLTYKLDYFHNPSSIETLYEINKDGYINTEESDTLRPIGKPYLFPISSITKEQKKDLLTHIVGKNNIKYFQVTSKGCIDNIDAKEQELEKFHLHWVNFNFKTTSAYIDWCNKNHIDIRGLIPKGLAIDATGKNIY